MKLKAGESFLVCVQKNPLGISVQNRDGERFTFLLTGDLAKEMALALLNIPMVGEGFDELAEQEALRRLEARRQAASN